ncbi:CRISPR-associated protein Cas4 [Cyanobacterium aponinum]|uniref:CRISPR-associated exonuclease Cas4 n=1 Tax=Cyanobacterium aponinum (strain PCC 10605) TaxID=755178 RepID=K9Z8R3_CYAAP|nr:CRISPR-associated protein Cas4 [Cyanobacterium aponinum]AFZ54743.1 CRISPR-associated exonuclease, Cas4 family [Cyanobacterium aponinum PCC 10605]
MKNQLISIASLNHYSYCPHRFWRMFCASEFTDNQYTIDGTTLHERVHTVGDLNLGETWQIRAIYLKSEQYKLIGKADLIEAENGTFYPVEYKRGKKGEWANDELQVVAQALCIEEMTGTHVHTGYIYYAQTHQRQEVEINSSLRQSAIASIKAIQEIIEKETIPKAEYSKKCKGCSLYSACLPMAKDKINRYRESE